MYFEDSMPFLWLLLLSLLCVLRTGSVSIEVYYSTHCPNCQMLIREGLVPLVAAGLPGEDVELTVLPWRNGGIASDGRYQPVPSDFESFGHVCAFRGTLPMPARIDAPALQSSVQFLACDMDNLVLPDRVRDESSVSKCAASAGLDWAGPDGIKACAEGGPESEGYSIMRGASYSQQIISASDRIVVDSTTPFIFLNGDLLECRGPNWCDATWSSDSVRVPLPKPGSLLEVTCSMLEPKPSACLATSHSTTSPGKYDVMCENCVEISGYRWSPAAASWHTSALLLGSTAALALALARCRGSREPVPDAENLE